MSWTDEDAYWSDEHRRVQWGKSRGWSVAMEQKAVFGLRGSVELGIYFQLPIKNTFGHKVLSRGGYINDGDYTNWDQVRLYGWPWVLI